MNVAALNHALRNIPAEQLRMHLCWGNYPGPHTCDVPLGDIADIVWSAKPQTVLIEGANPRHAHEFAFFEEHPLPDGKILCPGMIEPQIALCRASRADRPAHRPLRRPARRASG